MFRCVLRRWPVALLLLAVLAGAAPLAAISLRDARIRLKTLIELDPPAAPIEVEVAGHRLSVSGADVVKRSGDQLRLRAWAPGPTLRVVEAGGPGTIEVTVDNLLRRSRLAATGPVEDTPAGLARQLRFAPRSTRWLAFSGPDDDVAFFVLGDTGDNPAFGAALQLGAIKGVDFLLHTGDLVYDDAQIPNLRRLFALSPLPIYFVRGNHDYRNDVRIAFMRELGPPYYAFRVGGATFVVLDNAGDYLPGLLRHSTQYHWWTGALGESRPGPLYVAMHKPPFDRRTGDRRAGMSDPAFARRLMADFRRAGVKAVFTGDVHGAYLWEEDGISYVVSGEGFETPRGSSEVNQVAWARLRGGRLAVEFIPIWRGGSR
jgi:predicted phosphodiesterase